MNYQEKISISTGKRGGKPCINGTRITVYDILGWLATGMSIDEIISDFPELKKEDILAVLEFASEREHSIFYAKEN